MDRLLITGPNKLRGSVEVSRAKNSTLPILCATLLNSNPLTLVNLPNLRDIRTIYRLLEELGVIITREDRGTIVVDASNISSFEAKYDLVKTMRASILVLGPLLSRFGQAKVSLPGGCAIGSRPIDIHLMGLEKMGAQINLTGGYVEAKAKKLKGARITLPFPSVGATEHLMMAAVLADGETIIENAAREPEIEDLENFLNIMGGNVKGSGTNEIKIEGVKELKTAKYKPIGDRIEAATYLIAGLMTRSLVEVTGVNSNHLGSVIDVLRESGAEFNIEDNRIGIKEIYDLKGFHVDTAPFPGFPTDVQAQLMALATVVSGSSMITEHIFENRFMHAPELRRLGANIIHRGSSAMIEGNSLLTGAPVMCTDLRASAALVLAGLVAEGETEIRRIYHLDRGYEDLDNKFKQLGAMIQRIGE